MDAILIEGTKITLWGFDHLPDDSMIRARLFDTVLVIMSVDFFPEQEDSFHYFDNIKDPGFRKMMLESLCEHQNEMVLFVEIDDVYYSSSLVINAENKASVIESYRRKDHKILQRTI